MAEEDDPDFLDKLAESVADGDSIDWKNLEGLPPEGRRLLENLRLVAEIAEQHRSPVEDPVADIASTEPAVDRRGGRIGNVRPPTTGAMSPGDMDRWGHLEIRRKIGEGAFGEVFHAHDRWLDHPVALKLLKPEIAETDYWSRILHEARRLARVRHPNVVSVHGADMHDGRIGFWMDLIEGETLSDLVAVGRLSPGEAAHIGGEVCLALAAVHHASLIHRDVKAQNVMRTSDGGRIILMDFGAGEFIGKRSNSGRVRGTPLYLAPEIFAGADATVSSDIYALGVLLYHLVTGGYPVNGTSVESLVDAHVKGERRRLHDARPDLPASFVSIVERAIDPDPERRFASAGDFHAALSGEQQKKDDDRDRSFFSLRTLRRSLRAIAVGLGAIGVVLGAAWVLGLFASKVLEGTFHVDPLFTAGARDYLRVGLRALFPFSVVWMAYAAAVVALIGLRALVWPHITPLRRRFSAFSGRLDPFMLAGLIIGAGVITLIVLIASFWIIYYNGFTALALDLTPEKLDLSILGREGRLLHRWQVIGSTALSFLMGLAIWFWFPALEKRDADPSRFRNLKWAAAIVAFVAIILEVGTRPLIWDTREVVLLGNRQAFVIGSSSDELLLYMPQYGERRSMRVRQDAPDLRRNVARVALFQPVPSVK